MAGIVNAVFGAVVGAVLYPFRSLPPWVGLVVVSALAGAAMLLAFKRTSDQARLAEVKRRIHACLFEIRLFRDDFRAILRAQGEILRHNLVYLGLSLVPMLWVMVPLVLVALQLEAYYGRRGLAAGEATVLTVVVDDRGTRPAIAVEVPPGVRVDSPAVWAPATGEMSWRLVAERAGRFDVTVVAGSTRLVKRLDVTGDSVPRSGRRARSFFAQLEDPVEPGLPAAEPFEEIRVAYPATDVAMVGLRLHWLLWFFVLTIGFAFVLRGPLGVTI